MYGKLIDGNPTIAPRKLPGDCVWYTEGMDGGITNARTFF